MESGRNASQQGVGDSIDLKNHRIGQPAPCGGSLRNSLPTQFSVIPAKAGPISQHIPTLNQEDKSVPTFAGMTTIVDEAHFATIPVPGRINPSSQHPQLFRGQHHQHLAAFHTRIGFDLGVLGGVLRHALEQRHAKLLVRQFAAAEAQGDLHLVTLPDEAVHLFILVS